MENEAFVTDTLPEETVTEEEAACEGAAEEAAPEESSRERELELRLSAVEKGFLPELSEEAAALISLRMAKGEDFDAAAAAVSGKFPQLKGRPAVTTGVRTAAKSESGEMAAMRKIMGL